MHWNEVKKKKLKKNKYGDKIITDIVNERRKKKRQMIFHCWRWATPIYRRVTIKAHEIKTHYDTEDCSIMKRLTKNKIKKKQNKKAQHFWKIILDILLVSKIKKNNWITQRRFIFSSLLLLTRKVVVNKLLMGDILKWSKWNEDKRRIKK